MDERLVRWARGVKARQCRAGWRPPAVLWLFTDTARLPDPLPVIARLPRGLAGVVFRDDARTERAALARRVARLFRARGLPLAVAGEWRLAAALRAGLHLRGGRRPGVAPRWLPALTGSAHSTVELLRARRAGAAVVFLSPAFATASHPGARALGPVRWGLAAARARGAGALGGISGHSVRRLPWRWCHAAGAIGALGS